MSSIRLRKDLAALVKSPPPDVLIPDDIDSDDLSEICVVLLGPEGTPFRKGSWKLALKIPNDYPNIPPQAFFRTKIFHPNVQPTTGEVCVDTLKRSWTSDVDLCHILLVSFTPRPSAERSNGSGPSPATGGRRQANTILRQFDVCWSSQTPIQH